MTAFYNKNPNARTVIGWDGGVAFIFKKWKGLVTVNKDYPSSHQPTFKAIRKKDDK